MAKFILAFIVITGCLHLLLHHAVYPVLGLNPVHHDHHHNHVGLAHVHTPDHALRGNHQIYHPIGLVQVPLPEQTLHQDRVVLDQFLRPVQALLGNYPYPGSHSQVLHLDCTFRGRKPKPDLVVHRQFLHLDCAVLGPTIHPARVHRQDLHLCHGSPGTRAGTHSPTVLLLLSLFSMMSGSVTEQDLLQLIQTHCIDKFAKVIEEHQATSIARSIAFTEQFASEMAEKQAHIEQKNDERFERIQTKISDLLKSLSSVPSSPPADPPTILSNQHTIYKSPDPIPSDLLDPGIDSEREGSILSDNSQLSTSDTTVNEIEVSKRTLGFYPVTLLEGASSNQSFLLDELHSYLKNMLAIAHYKIHRLEVNTIWYEEDKRILFAEFKASNMCYVIFSHMKNLKGTSRIQKVFPTTMQIQYQGLVRQANAIRHGFGSKTRIDFEENGLVLLVKSSDQSSWVPASSVENPSSFLGANKPPQYPSISQYLQSAGILSDEEPSPDSNIPQCDGNDTLDGLDSSSISIRQAPMHPAGRQPYTLNEKKQVAGLVRDAKIATFEIEVTGDTNANLYCSTGFYIAVARPSFNITEGYADMVAGIPIKCYQVTHKKDQQGTVDGCIAEEWCSYIRTLKPPAVTPVCPLGSPPMGPSPWSHSLITP